MRSIFKPMALATLILSIAAPAFSQTFPTNPPTRPGREGLPDGQIYLQSNITLNLPFDPAKDIDPQVEAAQRSIYEVAARQCPLVLSVIAIECRITNLSNTANAQRYQQNNLQITVTAQITMAVKLKETEAKSRTP